MICNTASETRLCETQLLFLYVDLASFCDCKVQTDLIIMNFAKAFDKVSHRLLAQKLHHYGIGGHRYHNTSTSSHQWWKSLNDPLMKTADEPTDSACSAKWYTVWLPSPETNTSPQLTAAPEVMNRGSAPSAPSWLARVPCSFHERCLSWTSWTLALSRLLTSSNLNWPKNLFSNHHSPLLSFSALPVTFSHWMLAMIDDNDDDDDDDDDDFRRVIYPCHST